MNREIDGGYPLKKIEDIPGLSRAEREFARAYGQYIEFTHHSGFKFNQFDPSLRERFEQLKAELEETKESLANPNRAMELMFETEILFDTHGIQIMRRQWP